MSQRIYLLPHSRDHHPRRNRRSNTENSRSPVFAEVSPLASDILLSVGIPTCREMGRFP